MRVSGCMFFVGFLAFIGMTALCSFASYTIARELVIDARASGFEDLPSFQNFSAAQPTVTNTALPRPTSTVTNTPPPGVTFTPAPTSEPTDEAVTINDPLADIEPWNDPRRITILLMGIDQRSAVQGEEQTYRTDTMILIQVDPIQKRAGVLSIPRDLWVEIPGFHQGRINIANDLGDSNQLPEGGPGLAMETVRINLGVRVDYYIRINFDVFTKVVDTIAPNGVEVCPEKAIDDPKYPDAEFGFLQVHFDAGCQTLHSERLLQYARTRASEGSDFDRNRRQQEVIRGIQSEVLNAGGILNFITQIPVLYSELTGAYRTNLSLDEILRMARLASEITQENVTFNTINNLHVDFGVTEDGSQQILIPRQSAIREIVQETFNPAVNLSMAEMRQRAEEESASIVVYNNTTISGLASQTRDWLTSQGVVVTSVGNIEPPSDAAEIIIRDYRGKSRTTQYLAALLGLPSSAIRPGNDGLTSADIMIVVGSDIQNIMAGQ